jgi:nitrate reductase gamma subunit
MLDHLLFVIFPYVAVALAIVVALQRYFNKGFSYSSLSSQFLESNELFYGSVAWHFGILGALAGHVIGFCLPAQVLWFNSVPVRLYILESTGLLFGLLTVTGIVSLIVRRLTAPRVRAVTSALDGVVLLLLLVQVFLGVYIALFYRWGSSWFAGSAVPYLRSLWILQPDIGMIAPLPLIVKAHILFAYLLVAVFSFSRLVHMLIVPVQYLWRPYQLVIWNRNRKTRLGPSPYPLPAQASDPAAQERAVLTR